MRTLFAAGVLAIFLGSPCPSSTQVGSNPPIPPSWNQRPGQMPMPNATGNQQQEDPMDRISHQQLKKLNLQRQQQAKADAAKLLDLASELKKQMDAADANTISAKAAGDADQIIRLAKDIKSKMKPF